MKRRRSLYARPEIVRGEQCAGALPPVVPELGRAWDGTVHPLRSASAPGRLWLRLRAGSSRGRARQLARLARRRGFGGSSGGRGGGCRQRGRGCRRRATRATRGPERHGRTGLGRCAGRGRTRGSRRPGWPPTTACPGCGPGVGGHATAARPSSAGFPRYRLESITNTPVGPTTRWSRLTAEPGMARSWKTW